MVEQGMTTQAGHWRSRGNHGARRTTAHFPSRPKNHTAFLGLYGKVRRHPPCAVAFVPPISSLGTRGCRFKSCHSDHYLAPTPIPTVSRQIRAERLFVAPGTPSPHITA
jgi:hypothetical protein